MGLSVFSVCMSFLSAKSFILVQFGLSIGEDAMKTTEMECIGAIRRGLSAEFWV